MADALVKCHYYIREDVNWAEFRRSFSIDVYNFAFKLMDFAFKLMDFAFKLMDFAFKMTNFGR